MLKSVNAFFALLLGGGALFGAMTTASAHYREGGCCGPIPPTYIHKTIFKNKYITRDVYKTHTTYVPRIHRIVHVTDVQEINHLHIVTHVHHQIIGVVTPRHEWVTENLPPRTIVTYSTVNTYSCGCQ